MDSNNVHLARQLTVLKSVVEQMNMAGTRNQRAFRQQPGLVAAARDEDRDARLGDHERLVAETIRGALRRHALHRAPMPSVPAGKDIRSPTGFGQKLCQQNHQRRFA